MKKYYLVKRENTLYNSTNIYLCTGIETYDNDRLASLKNYISLKHEVDYHQAEMLYSVLNDLNTLSGISFGKIEITELA